MFAFMEPSWHDSLVSLLAAINGLSGAPGRTTAIRPLTSSDVVAIAQSLERRAYRPEQWFNAGGSAPRAVPAEAPRVSVAARYELIWFAAQPAGLGRISLRAGGMLYEDPFYAVLAGYNLGLQPAGPDEAGMVEVKVSSRGQAWAQRQQIVDALRQGSYRADRYFSPSGRALPAVAGASWRSDAVSGGDLDQLILTGLAYATVGATRQALYCLYRYVAP